MKGKDEDDGTKTGKIECRSTKGLRRSTKEKRL